MKPLKLSIQAFGPFVDKEVIDFTLLGNNPLFLINGPTGSGKSSILDAICFALYGKTTGNEREAAQMRCDQADPNTLTEITFDFSLGDKQYRVTRSPSQERAKVIGEGITEHKGEAHLWEIDSAGNTNLMVTKKLKQVTDAIEYLTGLNVEQFRQVMVLPQGKFRELLLADSVDREKIFSKLFQTNIYKRIEESLKTKAITINNNKKSHDDQIKGILEGADLNLEEEVENLLETQLPELSLAKEQKEANNKSLQNALGIKKSAEAIINQFNELDSTISKIKQKEELKPGIEKKKQILDNAQKAQKITPIYAELTRLTNNKQILTEEIKRSEENGGKLKQDHEKAAETLNQAKTDAKETDPLKQTKTELKQYEKKVEDLETARATQKQSEITSIESNKTALNKQDELDITNKNKESLDKTASEILQKLSELGPKQVKLQQLEQQTKQMLKLASKRTEHNKLIDENTKNQKELEKLVHKFETSVTYAKQQELSWHTAQAVLLAKELKEDEPCPVCGSTEHPKLAYFKDEQAENKACNKQQIVTKEQVGEARKQVEDNRVVMQDASDNVNNINSQINEINKTITEIEKELGAVASKKSDDIKQSYETLKSEVETLEKSKGEIDEINKNIIQCSEDIAKLKKGVDQAKKQAEADTIQLKISQSSVSYIENELPEEYRDKANLLKIIKKLEEKILSLAELLEKAQLNFDESKTNITKQETQHKGLITNDEKLSQQLSDAQAKWHHTIESSSFISEEQYKAAILTEDAQEALLTEISTFNDELTHLKGQLDQQKKSLKDSVKPDLEAINNTCEEKQSIYTTAETEWKKLDARVNQLKDVKSKLKKAHEKSAKLEAEYAIYGTLSNVANGRTGNNISLQRFVLSVLLDDVLIEASRRLNIMTKGRFQLLRKQDKSKGNKASGLELDVEDAYTGKSRSVATLSGGESFMAALALALGLSDVVQAYAGGIKLDTLFIDEGFGSLDQESLDLAIRTLIDLQATGRTIGIISHVSELKEQMALRLDVISSKVGSTIKTVAA